MRLSSWCVRVVSLVYTAAITLWMVGFTPAAAAECFEKEVAEHVREQSVEWHQLQAGARTGEATSAPCFEDEVLLHVRAQYAIYGPRSSQYEYFGFIYRKDGRVDSAVAHDFDCRGTTACVVNTNFALKRIPKGAKVLGEWHTHPHFHESDALTMEDVRGAQANRHIRCYTAFYSSSDGDIYRWNLDAPTVAAAMASRTRVGNYRLSDAHTDLNLADNSEAVDAGIIAAPVFPEETCLSTNTNAPTAVMTKKSCRRSPTSR